MADFDDAVDWLNAYKPFFATLVVNMGIPVYDESVPTACVMWDDPESADREVVFKMNPNFFDPLTDSEAAGVISHEALHIVLHHLEEMEDEYYQNGNALMIAQECTINDRLTNHSFELPKPHLTGPEYVGCDTSEMSVKDIYNMIAGKDDLDRVKIGCGHADQMESKTNSEMPDEMKQALADLLSASESALDKMKEAVQGMDTNEVEEDVKDALDMEEQDIPLGEQKRSMGGCSNKGFAERVEDYANENNVSFAWAKLMANVNADILADAGEGLIDVESVYSWRTNYTPLAHLAPKVILPGLIEGENEDDDNVDYGKESIALALDFSGSINRSLRHTLGNIARSIPEDKIDVVACTFSTHFIPFDHNKDRNIVASGGTDFSAVEKFVRNIEEKRGAYPKAVVILTDGDAHFRNEEPSNENMKNWHWVYTSQHNFNHYSRKQAEFPDDQKYILSQFFDGLM